MDKNVCTVLLNNGTTVLVNQLKKKEWENIKEDISLKESDKKKDINQIFK